MKVITLLPVKNEAWILPYSLKNFSDFSDHIIVADQYSTDGSREIYSKFPKVLMINNESAGHSNKIRWRLLEEARKTPGNNLIICLDADELLSPKAVDLMRQMDSKNALAFTANWIQLIEGGDEYRIDGVWKSNKKTFAFIDDRITTQYQLEEVINDHTTRIPLITNQSMVKYPILHLQYMAKARSEIKQVWYMCKELLAGGNPYHINYKYAPAKFDKIISKKTDPGWTEGVDFPPKEVFDGVDIAKQNEILKMLSEKGLARFEALDIWHVSTLHNRFVKEMGRNPQPKTYPRLLITLNDFKNFLHRSVRERFFSS